MGFLKSDSFSQPHEYGIIREEAITTSLVSFASSKRYVVQKAGMQVTEPTFQFGLERRISS